MGYTAFCQLFAEEASIPLDVARPVLERFGQVREAEIGGLELATGVDAIGNFVDLHLDEGGGLSGVSVSRPRTGFEGFAFALLEELGMAVFGQECEAIFATSDVSEHVPAFMLENAGGRVVVVTSVEDLRERPWRS